jgi:hypothetical protein
MNTTRPSPGLPAAAKAQQSGPQSDLEALTARARSIGRRAGWISRDEHLARLDQLLEDRPTRLSQFALVEREYRQAWDERIREKTEARPFRCPRALGEKILLYREVLQALEVCAGSLLQPTVPNDPRLEAPHRELIRGCRKSFEHAQRLMHRLANPNTPMWAKYYREVIQPNPPWGEALTSLRDYLWGLEQERDRLGAAHAAEIRSAAEAELGLVAALLASACESCSETHVHDQYVERVLDLLLALPASEPLILDDEVHRFFELAKDRLTQRACVAAPAVVVHVGRLVAMAQYARAGELLDRLAAAEGFPESAVVAYLHYALVSLKYAHCFHNSLSCLALRKSDPADPQLP